MADPIRLATVAYALVDSDRRPEIGDVVTVRRIGEVSIDIDATVVALEITDDGEQAILVDDTGARWALPIASYVERAA